MSPEGGSKKRFYLVGTDYVYPRTTNKILRLYLTKAKGVAEDGNRRGIHAVSHQDYQTIVGKIKSFCAGGDGAVINTINGDSNVPFFKELANQGITADTCPVISFICSALPRWNCRPWTSSLWLVTWLPGTITCR